jgi:hypothetical protein
MVEISGYQDKYGQPRFEQAASYCPWLSTRLYFIAFSLTTGEIGLHPRTAGPPRFPMVLLAEKELITLSTDDS